MNLTLQEVDFREAVCDLRYKFHSCWCSLQTEKCWVGVVAAMESVLQLCNRMQLNQEALVLAVACAAVKESEAKCANGKGLVVVVKLKWENKVEFKWVQIVKEMVLVLLAVTELVVPAGDVVSASFEMQLQVETSLGSERARDSKFEKVQWKCSFGFAAEIKETSFVRERGIRSTDVTLFLILQPHVLQGCARAGKCWFQVTIWMQLIYCSRCIALPDWIPWNLEMIGLKSAVLAICHVTYPVVLCNLCGSSMAEWKGLEWVDAQWDFHVDEQMQVPNFYYNVDVHGKMTLNHMATAEGISGFGRFTKETVSIKEDHSPRIHLTSPSSNP
ncbi:hypothetical protein C5167_049065 [Papaver somniferum]|uniref:Uncharacterized protein n=1 Tax=Papaver somniferum TaxID=3469 RepID=A0A4Y7KNX5_PAPSO|nr:hypothetical protein C5167_049065 [Papaver somniferum]